MGECILTRRGGGVDEDLFALKDHVHANYIDVSKVANNLVTTDTSMVLAASMGKHLNEQIDLLEYKIYNLEPL